MAVYGHADFIGVWQWGKPESDTAAADKDESPDKPDGFGTVYTYGDKLITREEYDELKLKMLGE